jgi:hypothetical protein
MTNVAIFPVGTESGGIFYHAVAGGKQSDGKTAGEALDALTAQLPDDEAGTLVLIQDFKPDRFFNAAQQQRLAELMERWRSARDAGLTLPTDEQAELESLIETETRAAGDRIAAIAEELKR